MSEWKAEPPWCVSDSFGMSDEASERIQQCLAHNTHWTLSISYIIVGQEKKDKLHQRLCYMVGKWGKEDRGERINNKELKENNFSKKICRKIQENWRQWNIRGRSWLSGAKKTV